MITRNITDLKAAIQYDLERAAEAFKAMPNAHNWVLLKTAMYAHQLAVFELGMRAKLGPEYRNGLLQKIGNAPRSSWCTVFIEHHKEKPLEKLLDVYA